MPRCKMNPKILCHYPSCDDRCPEFRRAGQTRLIPMTNHVMKKQNRPGEHIGVPRPEEKMQVIEVIERPGVKITRYRMKR